MFLAAAAFLASSGFSPPQVGPANRPTAEQMQEWLKGSHVRPRVLQPKDESFEVTVFLSPSSNVSEIDKLMGLLKLELPGFPLTLRPNVRQVPGVLSIG